MRESCKFSERVMRVSKQVARKKVNARKPAPSLRTRDLERAVRLGSQSAVASTLKTGRPITIAQNGWIVQKHADGTVHKIKKIGTTGPKQRFIA